MRTLITIFTMAVLFSSCDETKKVIDVAGNVQLSGNYVVSSIGEKAVTTNAPSMSFFAVDKSIKGNGGCNSFFGNYELDLYALSFSDIAATEMYCDEPVMKIETSFMAALRDTGSYSIEANILTLYSKNDRSVLLKAAKETKEQ